MSVFLSIKILERLVDRHIREVVLGNNPLQIVQYVNQSGKSTDTALNSVVITIEKELKTQDITLRAFLIPKGLLTAPRLKQ
jgi:hypothetical protein